MFFHSDITPLYFILPAIGFVVGLFATMLGGGGGFFFLPVLNALAACSCFYCRDDLFGCHFAHMCSGYVRAC